MLGLGLHSAKGDDAIRVIEFDFMDSVWSMASCKPTDVEVDREDAYNPGNTFVFDTTDYVPEGDKAWKVRRHKEQVEKIQKHAFWQGFGPRVAFDPATDDL